MAGSLINKYIWLIDTIQRRGRITRKEINEQWRLSEFSNGSDLPRRTFLNYRNGAEEVFKVNINYDPATYEYYIDTTSENDSEARVRNWLLDSMSLSGMMNDFQDIAHRIMVEDVPSARQHLPIVIEALRKCCRISFRYKGYDRSQAHDVIIEPYAVRIFKQLWYVIGRSVKDDKIKTYSLDRMSDLHSSVITYTIPEWFDGEEFFKDCFGIIQSQGEAKAITIRATTTQAKYFRALPLHHSQSEELHDTHSIFHYKMHITYDLIQQFLSYGPEIEILAPMELKIAIMEKLRANLKQYEHLMKD